MNSLSLFFLSTHSLSSSALQLWSQQLDIFQLGSLRVCACIPPLNGEFVKSVKLKSSFVSLACGRFNPERPGLSRHTHKHAYTHFYRLSLSFARQIPNSCKRMIWHAEMDEAYTFSMTAFNSLILKFMLVFLFLHCFHSFADDSTFQCYFSIIVVPLKFLLILIFNFTFIFCFNSLF